jgi:MFS transporter, PPP family, 3-phenylpropionic acid transporter
MSPAPRLAFFYAAMFSLTGVQLPFWPAWLAGRGLSAGEIGVLLALAQWVKLAANPLAGIAADKSRAPRPVMVLLSAGAALGFALLLPARGFVPVLLLGVLVSASLSALLPLGDHVALRVAYARNLDYGRVRLWGSLGFIAATLVAGRLAAARGIDSIAVLLLGAAALVLAASATLPAAPLDATASARIGRWRSLARPQFALFLVAAALIQGSHAVYYGFGTLYWRRLGISDETIALLWVEGVIAEIMLFYWGEPLLRRLGPAGLLVLGGSGGVVRWTATGFVASLPALFLLQALHALTFGAAHLGAMHYLARNLPPRLAATGQAIYAMMVGGVGQGLLMLVAGVLYGAVGGSAYLAMAAAAAGGAGLALLLPATKS